MKIAIALFFFTVSFSIQAQDIFVFKNGNVRTCYKLVQEFAQSLQVETQDGRQSYITLDKLSFVQSANGHQFIYDHATHPILTLVDYQKPHDEQCFPSRANGAVNAAAIDNQTPGSKAKVTGAPVTMFRDRCLMERTQTVLAVGDEVTIEQVENGDTPGFTGTYLVNFVSKDGRVIKGWVRRTNFVIQKR